LREEARRGRSVLVTTHLVAEWRGKADRCLLCENGRVTRELDPATLTRAFKGNENGTDLVGGEPVVPAGPALPGGDEANGAPEGEMPRESPSVAAASAPEDRGARIASDAGVLAALFRREIRTAVIGRQFWIFGAFALATGTVAAYAGDGQRGVGDEAPFFVLQVVLHVVPLFALLGGIGSAHAESGEWPLLAAQPGFRRVAAPAKFLASLLVMGAALPLLFVPALFRGSSATDLSSLFLQSLGVAAVFVAAGLAVGYGFRDRVQALLGGILAWLAAVFAYDFAMLTAARWTAAGDLPGLWIALLMVHPLDSLRIHALFSLEQIPVEAGGDHPLARWWIAHARLWYPATAAFWTLLLLSLTHFRLRRMEF